MLSRRVFLKSGALTLVSLGAGPRFLDRLALAAPASGRRPKVLARRSTSRDGGFSETKRTASL